MTLAPHTDRIESERLMFRRIEPSDCEFFTHADPIVARYLGNGMPRYTFDRNVWGQGYAGEAAARVFEYASSTMRFRRIVSVIHPDNTPSIKIAKRGGARQENNVMLMGQEFFRFIWPEAAAICHGGDSGLLRA